MRQDTRWTDLARRGTESGIWVLYRIDRLFGRRLFLWVLDLVVGYYVLRNGEARRASREYLRRLAERGAGGGKPLSVRRHFRAFGESLLHRLRAWSDASQPEVLVTGIEQLVSAQARGQGGVILTAHIGSADVAQALGRRLSTLKLNILVHIQDQDRFNRVRASVNPESQCEFFQVGDISPATGIEFAQRVAHGEFVMIAGDRAPISPAAPVVRVPFLGHEALLPAGPYQLASALDCPVYTFWCLAEGERYHAFFERLDAGDRIPQRATRIARLAEAFAARLESACLRYPYQWFNFYRFWHESSQGRTAVFGRARPTT